MKQMSNLGYIQRWTKRNLFCQNTKLHQTICHPNCIILYYLLLVSFEFIPPSSCTDLNLRRDQQNYNWDGRAQRYHPGTSSGVQQVTLSWIHSDTWILVSISESGVWCPPTGV